MEPLESKKAKALVIVEGERLEPEFFKQYIKLFGISLDLYLVGANIYNLYNQLRDYDFECNILDILPTLGNRVEGMADILEQKFAYTYLVFDFDAHHREIGEEGLDIDTIVKNNISKLREMMSFFTNETDPGVGKLYINYPMMESFRDCETFFDPKYADNAVSIEEISNYKAIAGSKRLSSIHISSYTKENFADLIRMNVYKLNKVALGVWDKLSYDQYIQMSVAEKILDCQVNRVNTSRKVDVLNTALFIGVDYFGNRDSFYNSLVEKI